MHFQSWRSPNQGRNNAAYRYNREGIYVTPSSRAFRDEEGKNFWVEIEIVDRHRFPSGSQAPYNVTVKFYLVMLEIYMVRYLPFTSSSLWINLLFLSDSSKTGKLVGSW